MYEVDKIQYLQIGVQGDSNATRIEIDVSAWAEEYPNATFHILFKPYNDDTVYPQVFTYNEETHVIEWTVGEGATEIVGVGYTEIRAQDEENNIVKKTRIIPTAVENSVSGVETTPPAAQQDWVTSVLNAATNAANAKTAAETAQGLAEDAQEAAEAARDAAQAAAGDFQGLTATAEGLPAGSDPSVTVTHEEGGLYNLEFSIPKGDKGDTGDPAPAEQVVPAVDAWLEDNITNPSNPPLDTSLSLSNAAAPANLVGDLKSALTSIADPVNLYPEQIFTSGSITYNEGNVNTSTVLTHTEFIDVEGQDYIIYPRLSLTSTTSSAGMSFYDSTKTYISGSGERVVRGAEAVSYTMTKISVPQGAKYARFTWHTSLQDNEFAVYTGNYKLKLQDEVDALQYFTDVLGGATLRQNVYQTDDVWAQGYWAIADGSETTSNKWVRSCQNIDSKIALIKATLPYKLYLMAYSANGYVGVWNGSEFTTTYPSTYVMTEIDVITFRETYPNYMFRLDITRTDGVAFTPSDAKQNVLLYDSVGGACDSTIKDIYGDIVLPSIWENGTVNITGKKSYTNGDKRLSTIDYLHFLVPVTIKPKNGYSFSVTIYSEGMVLENQFSTWQEIPYTFARADKLYKIVIKPNNSSELVYPANIADYIETHVLNTTPFDRLLAEFCTVKAIGHRGFNTVAPENTLPAYELSAAYGFKYVETDVLFTRDGVPVLMHDATINRTCCNAADGSALSEDIYIDQIDYDDLDDYDACTPAQWSTWKGTKIPTFTDFMHCCRANNFHVWIELKYHHVYTQSEIQEIISIVKQYGMEEHVSFISFAYANLALVKTEWDTVELGLNGSVADATALKTGNNRVFMIYKSNSSSYTDAINAGFQICFYTINTVEDMYALPVTAFDSILTNVLTPSQVYNATMAKYKSVVE